MRRLNILLVAAVLTAACGSNDGERASLRAESTPESSGGVEVAEHRYRDNRNAAEEYLRHDTIRDEVANIENPGPTDPRRSTAGSEDAPDIAPEAGNVATVETQGVRAEPATPARASTEPPEQVEGTAVAATEGTPIATRPGPTPERLIAEPTQRGEECVIRDRVFACARHFAIRNVPRDTRFFRVGNDAWEVVDARGQRIALIQESAWTDPTAGAPQVGQARRAATRTVAVAEWGDARNTRLVLEEFGDDATAYRIERRANGSNWIGQGWSSPEVEAELAPESSEASR